MSLNKVAGDTQIAVYAGGLLEGYRAHMKARLKTRLIPTNSSRTPANAGHWRRFRVAYPRSLSSAAQHWAQLPRMWNNDDSISPRPDAAEYISDRLGRRVSTGALHRHASDGTGPKYVMILGRASYTEAWLDDWINQLMRAPHRGAGPVGVPAMNMRGRGVGRLSCWPSELPRAAAYSGRSARPANSPNENGSPGRGRRQSRTHHQGPRNPWPPNLPDHQPLCHPLRQYGSGFEHRSALKPHPCSMPGLPGPYNSWSAMCEPGSSTSMAFGRCGLRSSPHMLASGVSDDPAGPRRRRRHHPALTQRRADQADRGRPAAWSASRPAPCSWSTSSRWRASPI